MTRLPTRERKGDPATAAQALPILLQTLAVTVLVMAHSLYARGTRRTLLFAGLSTLNLHESRHAMRYVLSTLGDQTAARYDATIARTALARLTPDQRAALTAYCRTFLPAGRQLQAVAG